MMNPAYQVTPFFVKTALRIKMEGVLFSYLLPQRVLIPPVTPSSLSGGLIVYELLGNTAPSIIAFVNRSPNTILPDNISLTCTLEICIIHLSDCVISEDFNCLKVNWVSNTAPPNTVDSIFAQIPSSTSVSSPRSVFVSTNIPLSRI